MGFERTGAPASSNRSEPRDRESLGKPRIEKQIVLAWRRQAFCTRDRRHLRAVPGGLVLGALVVAAVMLLFDSPVGAVAIDSAPRIRARAASLGIVEHYWTFALFLSLLHSLVEEYYWRWFVYGQLRRVLSAGPATLLASAAFTAHPGSESCLQSRNRQWSISANTSAKARSMPWPLLHRLTARTPGVSMSQPPLGNRTSSEAVVVCRPRSSPLTAFVACRC